MRQAIFLAVLNGAEKKPGELVWGKILRRMIEVSGNSDAAQRMRYLCGRLPQPQTGGTPYINKETRTLDDLIPTEKASKPNKATIDDAPLPQANGPTWSTPVNQDYSQLVEYAATIRRNRELRLARLGKRKEIDSQVTQDTSQSDQVAHDAQLALELQREEYEF
ncbi:MAG: hypothetical protein M1835_001687 [Candelina submexicana]|nr:MAG: hypothetical protein M1835_001687 [Candelina submexicana]